LLRPSLIGERADETRSGERETAAEHVLQGRGGRVEHAISGIDVALWDLFGKITKQPVVAAIGRQLPREDQAVRFAAVRGGRAAAAEKLEGSRGTRIPRDQARVEAVRRRDAKTDELLIRTAARRSGRAWNCMVDAGGSDAYWPHGYKWALRTAQMLAN